MSAASAFRARHRACAARSRRGGQLGQGRQEAGQGLAAAGGRDEQRGRVMGTVEHGALVGVKRPAAFTKPGFQSVGQPVHGPEVGQSKGRRSRVGLAGTGPPSGAGNCAGRRPRLNGVPGRPAEGVGCENRAGTAGGLAPRAGSGGRCRWWWIWTARAAGARSGARRAGLGLAAPAPGGGGGAVAPSPAARSGGARAGAALSRCPAGAAGQWRSAGPDRRAAALRRHGGADGRRADRDGGGDCPGARPARRGLWRRPAPPASAPTAGPWPPSACSAGGASASPAGGRIRRRWASPRAGR